MIHVDCPLFATTVTTADGKGFHPAVQGLGPLDRPYYWENVTYATEQEAYEHASHTVNEFYSHMKLGYENWSCVKL